MGDESKWQELKDLIGMIGRVSLKEWLKQLENLLDDPVDAAKEWLHCHNLPLGYQLNISFLMGNRQTTWDIIRKRGSYSNCDPEDQ
jgi:hypothetical protein